ncbi:MAG: Flp pilus assembly complex ATPase component TadA [Planctomycetes bacterium]|nr:Flp pilus assembly complex ATPase component TadA [Planctomycetota bacterium]
MPERLYSLHQVAALLDATPETVLGWVQTGWLAAERPLGREPFVSEAGLIRFLKDRGIDLRGLFEQVVRSNDPADAPSASAAHDAPSAGPSRYPPHPGRAAPATPPPAPAPPPPAATAPPVAPKPPATAATATQPREAATAETHPPETDPPETAPPDAAPPQAAPPQAESPDPPAAAASPEPQRPAAAPAAEAAGRAAEAVLGEAILREAIRQRADAVHLEPRAGGLVLRLRIDGCLYAAPDLASRLPRGLGPRLVAHFQDLAGIGGGGASHRGTFQLTLDGRPAQFRLAACPTACGTRLVIRPEGEAPALAALGLAVADLAALRRLLLEPSGLVLVAGPPGSGRTTLLRAMQTAPEIEGRKVLAVTLGDGGEAGGVERVEAGGPGGPAPAAAIAMAADQDADVLVVDEIRDSASATAVVEAALGGCLVLAAAAARCRWPDPTLLAAAQVDGFALASALRATICPRLVRTLCPHCRRPARAEAAVLRAIGFAPDDTADLAEAGPGCPQCGGHGYAGRTGLFSILRVDEALAALMRQGAPADAVREAARQGRGLWSLADAGREKLGLGLTSPREVLRALRLG